MHFVAADAVHRVGFAEHSVAPVGDTHTFHSAAHGLTTGENVVVEYHANDSATEDSAWVNVGVAPVLVLDADHVQLTLAGLVSGMAPGKFRLSSDLSTVAYDDGGRVTLTGDAYGHETTTTYNALGHKTQVTRPDPDGAGPEAAPVSRFGYDAGGNLLWTITPRGSEYMAATGHTAGDLVASNLYATTYAYDAWDRRVLETAADPDMSSTAPGDNGSLPTPTHRFDFDTAGDLVHENDARGVQSTYAYDARHRRLSVGLNERPASLSAAGLTVTVTLSGHGLQTGDRVLVRETAHPLAAGVFVVTRVDADTFTYPLSDARAFTDYALVSVSPSETSYDANGNVRAAIDARGNVTRFEYDNLNRKTRQTSPPDAGGVDAGAKAVTSYRYDVDGNLVAVIDPLGNAELGAAPTGAQVAALVGANRHATTYFYDGLNRQVTAIGVDPDSAAGGDAPPVTRTFYDAAGNVAAVFDAAGNEALGLGTGGTLALDAGQRGALNASVFGDASIAGHLHATTDGYDSLGRKVVEIAADPDGVSGALVPSVSTWSYDPNGNLLWSTSPRGNDFNSTPASATPTGFTTFHQYDALNRVVADITPDPDGSGTADASSVTRYGYDADGNLL